MSKCYHVVFNDGTTLHVEEGVHYLKEYLIRIDEGKVQHLLFHVNIKSIKITDRKEKTDEST